ncbi:cytochrome c oxidase subunit VIa [Saccharomycopsis crataegensis]|uniref:Cytochrome c oxidase subunit n=1 Tax=Saccharomycopsis crataegensis TaxID=43959 RepID=A0AAV5QTX3_9ASCO|nr:cytochrome c oxidase subunit VIa [Saccharomycopsis crataegensis]
MLSNVARRATAQTARRTFVRKNHSLPPYANEPAFGKPDVEAGKAFAKHIEAVQEHAAGTSGLWKKISFFVALPAIGLTAINTYFVEKEHAHHRAEKAKVADEDWPKDYEFQNIRNKDFFWGDGDKTLFWNPVINRHVKD